LLFICVVLGAWLTCRRILKYKNLNIWMWSYVLDSFKRYRACRTKGPIHIYFTLVDHFEPFHGGRSRETALWFAREWCKRYPSVADRFVDSDGNHPKHAIFFPEEHYDEGIVDMISDARKKGYFEVEIHLHHDKDTSDGLRRTLIDFKTKLAERHGLLRSDPAGGQVIYAFAHGNWALDNSRRDGRMCGVNDELRVLAQTGCYGDFTLPSAPSDTQTRKINSIYYATDDPLKPKSHDSGQDVRVGGSRQGDLLIIQGPLTLNWRKLKYHLFPGIENGEVSEETGVNSHRVALWVNRAPYVLGEPRIRFVKVYTHGCDDSNTLQYLLGEGLSNLYSSLCEFAARRNYVLHFVTPYEMCQKIGEIERSRFLLPAGRTATPDSPEVRPPEVRE